MPQNRIPEIRELVRQMLSDRGGGALSSDDDSLFVGGRLDSMAAVDLIMRLEQEFGVDFAQLDFDVSQIDSVAAIAKLVPLGHAA
jgi:acyl carrier protein